MTGTAVIIVAAGSGSRMGSSLPKQFLPVAGKEILVWTVEKFLAVMPSSEIVIVLPEEQIERWAGIAAAHGLTGKHKVVAGGSTRFASVKNGLAALEGSNCDYIAIHDGVRPLLSESMIWRCIETAIKFGTGIPVVEPVDSFRIFDQGKTSIINRSLLRAVQTPQVFRSKLIREAYMQKYSPAFTDDASVVEHYGGTLSFCEGEQRNIKVTMHDDLLFAEAILSSKEL